MKISYAITVCNEIEEIQRLLKFLIKNKRSQDEIVVQQDSRGSVKGLPDNKVKAYCEELEKLGKIVYTIFDLNGHFANFKNNLAKVCTGDYIFQIDADEMISEYLIENLEEMLKMNPSIDIYGLPRINTLEGLTQDHINKWQGQINEKGWINFPDYQWRIYKNNGKIKWIHKVHEVLNDFETLSEFPTEEEYCLYHPKTIEKQEKQNSFYDTL
jgi:hypothetical protein